MHATLLRGLLRSGEGADTTKSGKRRPRSYDVASFARGSEFFSGLTVGRSVEGDHEKAKGERVLRFSMAARKGRKSEGRGLRKSRRLC